jgi:hypothetical protein
MSEPLDPNAELTNSIVSTRLRQNPELAADAAALYTQSRETSAALAKQGFSRVDNITALPGGVTVYSQGQPGQDGYRTSQLTIDNAVSVVGAGINTGNPTTPQTAQTTQAPTVTVFQPNADVTAAPAVQTPTTPPATPTPTQDNGFRFADNGFRWGDVNGNLTPLQPGNPAAGQSVNLNVGTDFRVNSQFMDSPLSPTQTTAGTTIRFDPNSQLDVNAGYNFAQNGATANFRLYDPNPASVNNLNGAVTLGQNGTVANLGGAIDLGNSTLSGNVSVNQQQNTSQATVGIISNDAVPGTATTRPIPASTAANVTVTNSNGGTTIAADARIPVDQGTLTANTTVSPTTTSANIGYQSGDSNNAKDPNQYKPPSTTADLGYLNNSQTGNTTISASATLPINGDKGSLGINASNTSGANNVTTGAVTYTQGNSSYRATASAGDENKLGVGVTTALAPNTTLSGDVVYNTNTNRVSGTGSIASGDVNGGRFVASATVTDQGQVTAAATYQIGNRNPPAPMTQTQSGQIVDDAVVNRRISQLTGDDKKMYEQALAGVNRLNEGGANLQPARETALSIAVAAQQSGIRNIDSNSMMLGTAAADGRQNIIVGNGALDQPSTNRIGINRTEAANAPALDSLERLTKDNQLQVQFASPQLDQPSRGR